MYEMKIQIQVVSGRVSELVVCSKYTKSVFLVGHNNFPIVEQGNIHGHLEVMTARELDRFYENTSWTDNSDTVILGVGHKNIANLVHDESLWTLKSVLLHKRRFLFQVDIQDENSVDIEVCHVNFLA